MGHEHDHEHGKTKDDPQGPPGVAGHESSHAAAVFVAAAQGEVKPQGHAHPQKVGQVVAVVEGADDAAGVR